MLDSIVKIFQNIYISEMTKYVLIHDKLNQINIL